MTLEQFIAEQHGVTFWREFTFTQLKFRVPQGELELADNVVWFGSVAFIVQMKEREVPTLDGDEERRWFDNKVMRSAVKQVKDSMHFLAAHGSIPVANVRNNELEIRGSDLNEIYRIIIYKPGPSLPDDARVAFRTSQSVGFIHIFDQAGYARVLSTLIAPEEIRRYLQYRETSLLDLERRGITVIENDILAAYASDERLPTPSSRQKLDKLVNEAAHYDFSSVLGRLADHIENPGNSGDYSKIMLEFAKLPRSAWRAAKGRFDLVMSHARHDDSVQPYRFYFPDTNCSFMFAPLHPDTQTGPDRAEQRARYLEVLTTVAKYYAKADKGVGVQIFFEDNHFLIDWCLVTDPWVYDAKMEAMAEKSPFLPVQDQRLDGFHFWS